MLASRPPATRRHKSTASERGSARSRYRRSTRCRPPAVRGSPNDYLDAQRRLWFGDATGTPDSLEWQLALAGLLRSHGFLRRLLASMTSTAMEATELVARLRAALPSYGRANQIRNTWN